MLNYIKNKLGSFVSKVLYKRGILVHFDHSEGLWHIEDTRKFPNQKLLTVWFHRGLRVKLAKLGG